MYGLSGRGSLDTELSLYGQTLEDSVRGQEVVKKLGFRTTDPIVTGFRMNDEQKMGKREKSVELVQSDKIEKKNKRKNSP